MRRGISTSGSVSIKIEGGKGSISSNSSEVSIEVHRLVEKLEIGCRIHFPIPSQLESEDLVSLSRRFQNVLGEVNSLSGKLEIFQVLPRQRKDG